MYINTTLFPLKLIMDVMKTLKFGEQSMNYHLTTDGDVDGV